MWKDIDGYEGLYQVSDTGEVMNVKRNRMLKCNKCSGYLSVILCKDGKKKRHLVHRLVAQTFIPNPLNLPQVNHKDEDKTNNSVDNLEWCTAKYNSNYGTHIERVSEKNINGKLSKIILQFSKTGEFIGEWSSAHEIQRQLGYNRGSICSCCRGREHYNSSYGYIWKYKEVV